MTIQLSEADMRLLILWSKYHGRTKALYASQIISARIEANFDLIHKLLESEAKEKGISVEQLKHEWLSEDGFYTEGE